MPSGSSAPPSKRGRPVAPPILSFLFRCNARLACPMPRRVSIGNSPARLRAACSVPLPKFTSASRARAKALKLDLRASSSNSPARRALCRLNSPHRLLCRRSPHLSEIRPAFPSLPALLPAAHPRSPPNRSVPSNLSPQRASMPRAGTPPKPALLPASAASFCMRSCIPSGPVHRAAFVPTQSSSRFPIFAPSSLAMPAAPSKPQCPSARTTPCRLAISLSKRLAS